MPRRVHLERVNPNLAAAAPPRPLPQLLARRVRVADAAGRLALWEE